MNQKYKFFACLFSTLLAGFLCFCALAEKSDTSEKSEIPIKQENAQAILPKLLDLGAGKCIPCKAMKPILEDLTKNYKDKFDVEFIDVWKNRKAAQKYSIRIIPTQIFFDTEGKEAYRHEGFMGKDEILNKMKDMGADI